MLKLKMHVSVLLAILLMLAGFAFAQEKNFKEAESCGENTYWNLDSSGVLTVSGTGAIQDYAQAEDVPWYEHRASIQVIEVQEGVTVVGKYAFADCTEAISLELPQTLMAIGDYAFSGCAITRIDIPVSVEEIGANAFSGCENLSIYVDAGSFADGWCEAYGIDCIVKVLSGDGRMPWLLHGRNNQYTLTFSGEGTIYEAVNEYSTLWPYIPYIKTLVLNDGITGIYNNVFDACDFETVYLPNTISFVGNGAFGENPGTSNVYYEGTFFKAATVFPDALVNAKWHCSDYTVPGRMGTYIYETGSYAWAISPDGEYIVRGEGELKFVHLDAVHADIGGGITSLGKSLFSGHEKLKTVVLDHQIKKIDELAFNNCTALTDISLPDGLTSLGEGVFANCTSLRRCVIPESTQSIGAGLFSGCTSLESVVLYSRPETFMNAFYDTVGITSAGPIGSGCDFQFAWTDHIPELVFHRCLGLKNVIIPDSVSELGMELFRDCLALESAQLPDTLEVLPERIFLDCTSLKDFELPSGLKRIETGAFGGCTSLVRMTIPENVTSLGKGVFLFSTSMTDVYLPEGIIECGDENVPFNDYTFVYHYSAGSATAQTLKGTFFFDPALPDYRLMINDQGLCLHNYLGEEIHIEIPSEVEGISVVGLWDTFYDNRNILSVVIPDSVKYIDTHTFYMCTNLEQVEMSKSLEYLGVNAFAFCHSLKTIELPEGLKTIDWGAFQLCNSLTELYIPDSVELIGDYALNFCEKLEQLHLPASLKELGAWAFSNCYSLSEINIPDGITKLNENLISMCGGLNVLRLPDEITEIHSTVIDAITNQNLFQERNCCYYRPGTTTMHTMFDNGIDQFRSPSAPDWEILLMQQEDKSLLAVLDHYYGDDESVLVPAQIDGVAIAGTVGTFADNTRITRVELEEGCIALDYDTFSGCTSLCEVVLPESLQAIETGAFRNCSDLTYLVIPEKLIYIGGVSAFEGCADGFALYVRSGSYAEAWCIENSFPHVCLCTEHVPQSIPRVEPTCTDDGSAGGVFCATCGDILLEPEIIPAFGHSEVTESAVPATHATTGLTEGKKCSICETVLVEQSVIPAVEVQIITLPTDLLTVEEYAFANSTFRCVVLPQGCRNIGAYAFANNPYLLFVEIPASVEEIPETAFDHCGPDLIIVTTPGSAASDFAREYGIRYIIK